ncbi:MAG: 16S rRNA (guanine(966)-N(2))-methyltransferase RsmD [Anaerovoracaceae bacterium]|nr:16S rRNA (guanine(966)-N(2))-methyltransferase RsmD [Anaerovoracaceae bacterium]
MGKDYYREDSSMRIIAGEFKGRRLESPADYSIRPTTDKVKEALFSILTEKLWGSRVLDLFSGTGNLGIEALSRGAAECVFCDSSRDSLKLIKSNIAHCRAEKGAKVMAGDFRKTLMNLEGKFDIIFLDPPYQKGFLEPTFSLIRERELLAEGGIIVAEHRKEEDLPDDFCGFEKIKERKYGIIKLSIYS